MLKLLPLVPDGCVCFFPSYSYLEQVVSHWQSTRLWTRLSKTKPIFRETQTSGTEQVLSAYTNAVKTSSSSTRKGALLLAVIGGRLSEGINFSDDLGRCVMVVGLPYANPNTAEQRAKRGFIEERAVAAASASASTPATASTTKTSQAAAQAAKDFADNTCMRAVNQAIGRAVRHKNDWSAILLFDARYTQKRIQGRLPGWIKASMRGHVDEGRGFKEVEEGLKGFYAGKMNG